jgi:hypothetical protein
MSLLGNGRQTSLFGEPASKRSPPKASPRASLRAFMTRRPVRQQVPGSPLRPSPYSEKNLTDGNYLDLQPMRGKWIVTQSGEYMGSVRKLKAGWELDAYPRGGRNEASCRRAADLLQAHFEAVARHPEVTP